MTGRQRILFNWAQKQGGSFTKAEAVYQFGPNYYCNGDKHVGAILSRMVNSGILERPAPGKYRISEKPAAKRMKQKKENLIQKTLFEP